jgi:hypothetical protein
VKKYNIRPGFRYPIGATVDSEGINPSSTKTMSTQLIQMERWSYENHEDSNRPPNGALHRLSRLLFGLCPAGEQAVVLGHGWNPYYLFGWPVNRL